jgi:hypothetical protein
LTEEEKTPLLDSYNNHVQLAKEQRDHYRMQCSSSKQKFSSLDDQLKGSGEYIFLFPSKTNVEKFLMKKKTLLNTILIPGTSTLKLKLEK